VLYYTTQNEFSVVIYELKSENFLLPLNGSIVNKCRDNELILGMLCLIYSNRMTGWYSYQDIFIDKGLHSKTTA